MLMVRDTDAESMRFADGPYDPGRCFAVGAGIGTEGQVLSCGTGI
jgi:hypothetical protein